MDSAVARPVRVLIGGVDFSDCFVSYSGARSTADTSGLLSITGQIELRYVPGKTPESLDDRLNPARWSRGQEITGTRPVPGPGSRMVLCGVLRRRLMGADVWLLKSVI